MQISLQFAWYDIIWRMAIATCISYRTVFVYYDGEP